MGHYQDNYSGIHPSVLDQPGRSRKARMIGSVLADYVSMHPVKGNLLDIGCSGGIITRELPFDGAIRIGTDIDTAALHHARAMNLDREEIHFVRADGMYLPFRNRAFGVIVCNHVYEHVPSASALFSEVSRVMKQDGCCYLSAGNRLGLREPHHGLLFLSWMPREMATRYVRFRGTGEEYYEHLRTWPDLKRLLSGFIIEDYTIPIMKKPEKYLECVEPIVILILHFLPIVLLRVLYPFLPTWILLLRHRRQEGEDSL